MQEKNTIQTEKNHTFEVESFQLSKAHHPKTIKKKLAGYFVLMVSLPILSTGTTVGWTVPTIIVLLLGVFFWFGIENHYNKRYPAKMPVLQIISTGIYFPLLGGNRTSLNWSEVKSIEYQDNDGAPILEFIMRVDGIKFFRLQLQMYEVSTQKAIVDAVWSTARLYQPSIKLF